MPTYSAAATIPAVDKDVPLSLFGGANTELSPSDLPEGGSPASQDVEFIPGGVFSRRGMHQVLTTQAPASITYLKTYVQPNGIPINLFSDALGNLWTSDPFTYPAHKVLLRTGIAGLFNQSVTVFGREYIATSDGQVGADIPLQFDGTNLDRVTQDGPGAPPSISDLAPPTFTTSITAPAALTISSATEDGTLITIVTTTPHGLYVGDSVLVSTGQPVFDNYSAPIAVQAVPSSTSFSYEVGITGLPTQTSGTVQSLVFTVVTGAPHGEITGDQFMITGTSGAYDNNFSQVISGPTLTISAISETGNIVTVVVTTPHNLWAGEQVIISGVGGNGDYNNNGLPVTVLSASSPTSFTYALGVTGLSNFSSGSVNSYVLSVSPANWTVRTVVNATTITFNGVYKEAGTVTTGTLSAGGLSSEGVHQCVVMFLTRQGAITTPSPPISFTSAGGRKYSISNLPIGPPNVVARVLGFSGSGGDNFFSVETTQVNGFDVTGKSVIIGTSTEIPDNTSTTATIDIADNTLFAATGIDIPGNNLFAQVVLGPCLGFGAYASRLLSWGERQKIQNFLNMGFGGGYVTANQPLGWTVVGSGTLVNSDVGMAWEMPSTGGKLTQSAYQDWTGAPIIQPNSPYIFRFRALSSIANDTGQFQATLTSASTGFNATAVVTIASFGTARNF